MNHIHHKRKKNRFGFTLIETLVVVAAVLTIFLILLAIFVEHLKLSRIVSTIAELQNNRTVTALNLEDAVHSANSFVSSAVVNGTVYTSDKDTLVLRLLSIDGDGATIAGEYDYIALEQDSVDSTLLVLNQDADALSSRLDIVDKVVSINVENLSFSYNGLPASATNVLIQARFTKEAFGKSKFIELSQYLILKNL
jgi:type II secretory pathway pseudopilin PulG